MIRCSIKDTTMGTSKTPLWAQMVKKSSLDIHINQFTRPCYFQILGAKRWNNNSFQLVAPGITWQTKNPKSLERDICRSHLQKRQKRNREGSSIKQTILADFYTIPSKTKTLIPVIPFSRRVYTLFTKQMFYLFVHKLFFQKMHFKTLY